MTISRTIKINRVLAIVALFLAMASTSVAQEVNTGSTTPSAKFDDSALQRIMPTRYGGHWLSTSRARLLRQPSLLTSSVIVPDCLE